MSTILDALRRVETGPGPPAQKPAPDGDAWDEAVSPPTDAGAPTAAPDRGPRAESWRGGAGVAALGVFLIGLGGWLVLRAPAPGVAADPGTATPSAPAPRPSQRAEAVQPEAEAARAPVPAPSRPAVPAPAPSGVAAEARQRVQARFRSQVGDAAPPVPPAPARAPARTRPAELAPPPETAVVATAAPAPRTPPAVRADRVARVAVIAPPPALFVEQTQWHPSPERRLARVDVAGQSLELREGQQTHGVRVVEIRPSAVVFEHAGVRIERKVGRR